MDVNYSDAVAYGFDVTEEEWGSNYLLAKAVVDRIVGFNEITDEDAYKCAVCAAVCQIVDGVGDSPNLSIGGFSIGATAGGRESARMAALDFLIPAGMAYTGV